MILAWMGYATLAAAALGGTAWLVDFAVGPRFQQRRLIWIVALLTSLIAPIAFSVTRGIPTSGSTQASGGSTLAAIGKERVMSDRVLGLVWLGGSAAFALWLAATQSRLRRRLRGCPSRVVDGERVLVSARFGPAVVGVARPQIVLPEWALAMPEGDRRVIVAHETEHREARDPLLAAVGLIVVGALPWNAALWWQLGRLRLAIEIDCDRRVVSRRGHDPHAYGMLLLATRERASRIAPAMAMAMAAMRSGLGRRVEALVGARRGSAVRRLCAGAAAGVLTTGVAVLPAPRLSIVRAAAPPESSARGSMSPPGRGSVRALLVNGTLEYRVLPSNSAFPVEARWVRLSPP